MLAKIKKIFGYSLGLILGVILFFLFALFPKFYLIENWQNALLSQSFFTDKKVIELPFWLQEKKQQLQKSGESFIEINLTNNFVILFENGQPIKNFQIIEKKYNAKLRGDPIGFFKIILKQNLALSDSGDYYIPYIITFNENWSIYGVPYSVFSTGSKKPFQKEEFSIILAIDDAKEVFEFAKEGMPILVWSDKFQKDNLKYEKISNGNDVRISAESYLVADLQNGFVFLQKDIEKEYSIASLIKLILATVVLENVTLDNKVQLQPNELEIFKNLEGFKQRVKPNFPYSLVDLLYLALCPSANDAAFLLSKFLGTEKTIKLMQQRVLAIGMENTKIFEVTGLGELIGKPENKSTAKDLFYLAQLLNFNKYPILQITKGEKISGSTISLNLNSLENRNIFQKQENFLGGKIGFTESAGKCGIFLFKLKKDEKERNVVIILLKSANLKEDTENILNWLNKHYFTD